MSVKSLKTGTRTFSMLAGNVPEHHVLLAETTVGAGGAASVTFSSIPGTYEHLQIRGIVRVTTGTAGFNDLYFRFNSDSGSNYARHSLVGGGGSAVSDGTASIIYGRAARNTVQRSGNTASCFGAFIFDVLDYSSTSKNKTIRSLAGGEEGASGSVSLTSSLWASTNAITSVTFTDESGLTFAQYSTFSLYGVK